MRWGRRLWIAIKWTLRRNLGSWPPIKRKSGRSLIRMQMRTQPAMSSKPYIAWKVSRSTTSMRWKSRKWKRAYLRKNSCWIRCIRVGRSRWEGSKTTSRCSREKCNSSWKRANTFHSKSPRQTSASRTFAAASKKCLSLPPTKSSTGWLVRPNSSWAAWNKDWRTNRNRYRYRKNSVQ